MMKPWITIVACAHLEKGYQCPLVDSMLNQTNTDGWKLLVYHNGANEGMKEWIQGYDDSRITYTESLMDTGQWGTSNRADALERLVDTPYIINSSIQDYYLPNAIDEILTLINVGTDFIHWQAINHLFRYNIISGEIAFGHLDWGQVCVRSELLKKSGIRQPKEFVCDWHTFQGVLPLCKKVQKINQILTIHN